MAKDLSEPPANDHNKDLGDATPPEPPDSDDNQQESGQDENVFQTGQSFQVRPLNLHAGDRQARTSHGRRTVSQVRDHRGRYIGATLPQGKITDLAIDATVRAAAPFQFQRRTETFNNLALQVEPWDLRQKVRESRVGNLVVFVVDASGSMGAQQRMVATKGAVISLLLDAYQRRDKVAMIAFRGTDAEVVLSPTSSAKLAQEHLENMPTGGRTPLAGALLEARKLIRQHQQRDKDMPPLMVIVSDCRANVGVSGGDPFDDVLKICEDFREDKIQSIVLDPAPRSSRFGLVQKVNDSLGGRYIPLEELRADAIRAAVRNVLDSD